MALDTIDRASAPVTLAQAPVQPTPTTTATPVQSPTSPASPTTDPAVDQATQQVKGKLNEDGWFNDVTNDELKDIAGTFDRLNPQQRNEVIKNLSDAELKKLADESGSMGIFGTGGLSRDEKRAMLEDMVQGADGTQLERLSKAFSSEDDAKLLGDAIASHAGNDAKLDFVKRMAGQVEGNEQVALQVAKAIGGMKGSATHVDQALEALSGNKLHSVVQAAQQENLSTNPLSRGTSVLTYDVGPLQSMIDAAATGNSVEQKARLFDSAATVLNDISKVSYFMPGRGVIKNDAEARLTQSLSKLITSDTNGVMAELESQFRSGKAITTFTKQMIEQGRTDELKVIVSQLQKGNDLQGDPLQRFTATDANGDYVNAQTLGYFVGSVHAASHKLKLDVDRQVSTFKAIFGGGLSGGKDAVSNLWLSGGAAKAVLGVGVGAVAAIGLLTADEIGRSMKAGVVSQRDALTEFAYPRLPNGRLYEGEQAETPYDTAAHRVFVENQ